MNLIELSRAPHQLRPRGMVAVLETRLLRTQTENLARFGRKDDIFGTLLLENSSVARRSVKSSSAWVRKIRFL